MKTAIAFLTKDRVELTKQTYGRVADTSTDIFWCDGSKEEEALELFNACPNAGLYDNVRGGADAAIVFALTKMLQAQVYDSDGLATGAFKYTHVGLCENDVLLHPDWFGPTMSLFERGASEGLEVGAVSARAYEDRVLIQRDGYAVMHNLGAGHVIFSRKAAQLVLKYYRTGWWPDNRAVFSQLSGLDIGRWGAFRTNAQWLTADWHFDTILAHHGLASLALTPSPVEMIGQDPSLEEQGLRLAKEPVELLRNNQAFKRFVANTATIRDGGWKPQTIVRHHHSTMSNSHLYFAHQLPPTFFYEGDWKLKWSQGFGPFAWQAVDKATLRGGVFDNVSFPLSGPGKVKITDTESGYEIAPELPPNQLAALAVPGAMRYRPITIECDPGVVFYGMQAIEPQPKNDYAVFDYSRLPRVE